MSLRTRSAALLSALTVAAAAAGVSFLAPAGVAAADPCTGAWSIGIAGLGNNNSSDFWGRVNQPVGYNSNDPITGLWELDRLFW